MVWYKRIGSTVASVNDHIVITVQESVNIFRIRWLLEKIGN